MIDTWLGAAPSIFTGLSLKKIAAQSMAYAFFFCEILQGQSIVNVTSISAIYYTASCEQVQK